QLKRVERHDGIAGKKEEVITTQREKIDGGERTRAAQIGKALRRRRTAARENRVSLERESLAAKRGERQFPIQRRLREVTERRADKDSRAKRLGRDAERLFQRSRHLRFQTAAHDLQPRSAQHRGDASLG